MTQTLNEDKAGLSLVSGRGDVLVRGGNCQAWEYWQLLFVDRSATESGVPTGGIVPGAVRVWLLGLAAVNLQINVVNV